MLHAHYAHSVLTGDPERPRVDADALDLVGRMHGPSTYARTRDLFDLPRPLWPLPGGESQAQHKG